MHKNLFKRRKIAATFIMMLLVITFITPLLPEATANTVTISIYPKERHVGDVVQVNGTIETQNGKYIIFFDGEPVENGTAVDKVVNTSIVIPHRPKGNYNVTLHDETTKGNGTDVFTVETAYCIEAVAPSPPSQLQEGETTDMWVNVTGGEANTVYFANITVKEPSPASLTYWTTVWLTNTTTTGSGNRIITYPSNFTASAHTNYTGIYNMAFNETLASGNFTVGLTNATEYHRLQVVSIRAAGYTKTNESAWVNITHVKTGRTVFSENVSAIGGVIEANWMISSNASMGVYTVTVANSTTPGTVKPIRDVQNFTVRGIDPTSGPVGTIVRIFGQIDTKNGTYRILWDGESVKEGVCAPGSLVVNDTFVVPPSVKGNHNITLHDVTLDTESMPFQFEVMTSYNVSADPTRIQEGLNTAITVDVRGAEANKNCTFVIDVTDPTLAHYNTTLNVPINATGSGSNSTLYYEDFPDANASYVGDYSITVNATLATSNFTVGITDRLEYGRTETGTEVNIRGAGYAPDDLVLINITFAGESIGGYATIADSYGVFIYYWQIPKDAQLGTYTVILTNETGDQIKPVPDIQNFTVVAIIVYCETQNIYDGKPLADVTVEAYLDSNLIDSRKTNKTGFVDLQLDFGNYTFKAKWKGEEVGRLENQTITENITLPFLLECVLASVTIMVTDEAGLPLPFINLTLISEENASLQFPETDSKGIATTNAFTNISYRIEARRYGYLFFNQSIGNITFTLWINITCPAYAMFVHVLDSKGLPLQNVQVVVYELGSEQVVGSNTTDADGSVSLIVTFGRYTIRVCNYSAEWKRTVVFNETVIYLTEDQQSVEIRCRICNLELSIVVTDYFGQPIPNAMVKVEREFGEEYVNIANLTTRSDGTVFLPKIGGRYRISIYVGGKLFAINTLYLDKSKVIEFGIDKLVVVGGYPLETTQFLACILLGIMVIMFALILIYRRLRLRKAHKGEEKEKSL